MRAAMSDSDKAKYVASLSVAVRDAALRIHLRMCGTVASDLWEDDPDKEQADYQLIAQQQDNLEPSPQPWTIYDKAECWVREFIPWILKYYLRNYEQ